MNRVVRSCLELWAAHETCITDRGPLQTDTPNPCSDEQRPSVSDRALFFKEYREDQPIPQPIPTDTQFVSFWSPVRPSPVWNWTSLIDQDKLWWKRVTAIPSCWTNPYSTTSVLTPAAPPAPLADMHWQQHHFIAPAPEEEPPLPAAWPEAPPKAAATAAATAATTATTTTASQQRTARSPQAQQHWRGPGGNRARDFLDMGCYWWFWWSSDFTVIYVICLYCQKEQGTRASWLALLQVSIMHQNKSSHNVNCMLLLWCWCPEHTKPWKPIGDHHICWWHIPQTNNFVRNSYVVVYLLVFRTYVYHSIIRLCLYQFVVVYHLLFFCIIGFIITYHSLLTLYNLYMFLCL